MSLIRVLVVDDFEPFRRFVSSTLQERPELRIVGEASDGLEAVQQVERLRPALVLLDIGLPGLNGIEVARQIREVAPASKILFLTQETSADVARTAFSLGAGGYVVKANAQTELLAAIEAVLQGKQFMSRGVATREFSIQDTQNKLHDNEESYCFVASNGHEGLFRVDMDVPMPVDLPEEEQILRILHDSYVADCNDAQAMMYGLNSARELIGRRMAEMVVPDDSKNIELTREFIRSGYRVLRRQSYEVDTQGNTKVFLNIMCGVIIDGNLVSTLGMQSDVTELAAAT